MTLAAEQSIIQMQQPDITGFAYSLAEDSNRSQARWRSLAQRFVEMDVDKWMERGMTQEMWGKLTGQVIWITWMHELIPIDERETRHIQGRSGEDEDWHYGHGDITPAKAALTVEQEAMQNFLVEALTRAKGSYERKDVENWIIKMMKKAIEHGWEGGAVGEAGVIDWWQDVVRRWIAATGRRWPGVMESIDPKESFRLRSEREVSAEDKKVIKDLEPNQLRILLQEIMRSEVVQRELLQEAATKGKEGETWNTKIMQGFLGIPYEKFKGDQKNWLILKATSLPDNAWMTYLDEVRDTGMNREYREYDQLTPLKFILDSGRDE